MWCRRDGVLLSHHACALSANSVSEVDTAVYVYVCVCVCVRVCARMCLCVCLQ